MFVSRFHSLPLLPFLYTVNSATGVAYCLFRWDASDSAPIMPTATGEDAEADETNLGAYVKDTVVEHRLAGAPPLAKRERTKTNVETLGH